MTDEERAQQIVSKMYDNDPFSRWLGIERLRVEPGLCILRMAIRREMLNGFGIAHGGMIFALADTAFALSCNPPEGSEDTITVASGVDINFLKPGMPGRLLTASARRVSQQGRSGLYDITVTQPGRDGATETVAEFRGRSRTVPKPKSR